MIACETDLYIKKDKALIKNIIKNSDVVFYNMFKLDKEHLECNYIGNLYYLDGNSKFYHVIIHCCGGRVYTYFCNAL